jgi:hypothetical protein
MPIEQVSPEQLAELFYLYHEALEEGVAGARSTHPGWSEIAQDERRRMVAAVRLALLDLGVTAKESAPPRPHFATPGKAEWGC